MGRILLLAIAAYVYGSPSFDGRRPVALDVPLREFKRNVDMIETDSPRMLAAIDRLRGQYNLEKVVRALNGAL